MTTLKTLINALLVNDAELLENLEYCRELGFTTVKGVMNPYCNTISYTTEIKVTPKLIRKKQAHLPIDEVITYLRGL